MDAAADGDDRGGAAAVFCPTARELVDDYLRPVLAGEPLPAAAAGIIHETNICELTPDELAATHAPAPASGPSGEAVWYFISPVRDHHSWDEDFKRVAWRKGGSRLWLAVGRPKAVKGSAAGGCEKTFRFHHCKATQEWTMVEYSVPPEDSSREKMILCKMFSPQPALDH